MVLLNDHAVGQVLWVVFKELSGGPGTVGQLQLLQFLQLNEAWQTISGQQGAAWGVLTTGRVGIAAAPEQLVQLTLTIFLLQIEYDLEFSKVSIII